jgi:hypothetical protein
MTRSNIVVVTSKGENLIIREVEIVRAADSSDLESLIIRFRSNDGQYFDRILRDRDIELSLLEDEDVGF